MDLERESGLSVVDFLHLDITASLNDALYHVSLLLRAVNNEEKQSRLALRDRHRIPFGVRCDREADGGFAKTPR